MKSVGCPKWLLRAGMRFRQANGAGGKAALDEHPFIHLPQASNRRLADKVHLGTPAVLSRNLTRYYRERQSDDLTWKRLTSKSAA
jgi:hypothetical protein